MYDIILIEADAITMTTMRTN